MACAVATTSHLREFSIALLVGYQSVVVHWVHLLLRHLLRHLCGLRVNALRPFVPSSSVAPVLHKVMHNMCLAGCLRCPLLIRFVMQHLIDAPNYKRAQWWTDGEDASMRIAEGHYKGILGESYQGSCTMRALLLYAFETSRLQ